MSIRFAPALSAAALAACLAAPAFAAENDAATTGPVDTAAAPASDDTADLVPMIAPVDLLTATGAEDATPAITVSGSATLTSDYRLRGVSQSDEGMAIQGGFTIAHSSGLYVSTWASNLAGWGTFGGSNMKLDLIAGYKLPVGQGTLDAGLTWYMYPNGADITDYAELYAKLSGTVGPVGLTAGVAYAPSQEALGNWFPVTGPARIGDKEDNLYLTGDAVYGIADTPLSLKAHIGYSDGNPGLGPNGTSIAPTGKYFDWLLGADFTPIQHLTFTVAYIDTDISEADARTIRPNFATLKGESISDATVVLSVTAAF